jgi:hypothetical protein
MLDPIKMSIDGTALDFAAAYNLTRLILFEIKSH